MRNLPSKKQQQEFIDGFVVMMDTHRVGIAYELNIGVGASCKCGWVSDESFGMPDTSSPDDPYRRAAWETGYRHLGQMIVAEVPF